MPPQIWLRERTHGGFRQRLSCSGDDASALDLVLLGGAGVIVLAGAMSTEFAEMIQLDKKRIQPSESNSTQTLPFGELIFEEGNPTGLKSMLNSFGYCRELLAFTIVPASVH